MTLVKRVGAASRRHRLTKRKRDRKLSDFSNRAGSVAIDYVLAPGGNGGRSDENDIFSTVPLSLPGIPYRYYFGWNW